MFSFKEDLNKGVFWGGMIEKQCNSSETARHTSRPVRFCDTILFTFIENLFQSLVTASRMAQKLRFAVVCSSNMNRSMEAHSFLQKKGYDIKSYGTGNMIKVSVSNDKI